MPTLVSILKNKYLPFLFALPLFFLGCRYNGIVVDAVLYVTQYVNSIDSSRFLGDPAFAFGNQGSLGFFAPILGVFLERLGVSVGAFVYTLLMQLAWIVAAVCMVKALLRLAWQRLWILPITILLLCVFAYGMAFSHLRWFYYVSNYACSRSLSMALGIAGMALAFGQKRAASLALILIGTVIHPLSAGWCLAFWMFYFFPITRIPVAVLSVIFPLSFLLHSGIFDIYPMDWLSRPLVFRSGYEEISRFVLMLVFWGSLVRSAVNWQVRNIAYSLGLVTFIAFYWDMWAGYGEHIFLYQVQPWRIFWLSSVVAVPMGFCSAKDSIRRLFKKGGITTHGLGVIILVVSFFSPINILFASLVALVLILRKNRDVSLRGLVVAFAIFLLGGYLVQQYQTWCLQGFPSVFGNDILTVGYVRDSFLVYHFFFVVGFAVFFVRKRRFVLASLLVLSVFLSRFMLLPVLPLFLYFFPRKSGRKYWGCVALVVLLILFDGLIDTDARRAFMLQVMPRAFFWVGIGALASLFAVYSAKWFSYKGIVLCLLVCSVAAVANYSNNSADWWEKESRLDYYLHHSLFPQVKDRGKILFYVSGPYVDEPRLQFMTGSYLTNSGHVGSIFYKEQHLVTVRRSHLLFLRDSVPESSKYYDFSEILGKIADVDTLVDRTSFLCGLDEISHLVTDKEALPFVKVDSAMVRGEQKVYLYACPPNGK
jgi:hypothetical protein